MGRTNDTTWWGGLCATTARVKERQPFTTASAVAVPVLVTVLLSGCASPPPPPSLLVRHTEAMRLIGAGQYQNQRAEALLEQLVAEGYIQAIDTLLALYQPGWGWQPNPEKYTKYLIQGANWEGKVTDREDEQTLRRTQARLAYAYLSGQDEKNYSGRMQNGTYVKDTKYRQSSLPKDIEKACYWLEKSLQGKDRSDSVAIASMVENCPIRAAQLGFGAADKERAEQDLKRSFDEYQQRRRFRNSPEGQVRHREKELEQEETDRRYEEAKRQDAQAQREFLGQAAGMLGQVLQNKRGAGDR